MALVVVGLSSGYPTLDICKSTIYQRLYQSFTSHISDSAQYPSFDLYPEPTASRLASLSRSHTAIVDAGAEKRRRPKFSHADLHESVFGTVIAPRRKPKHSHADLHEMVVASIPVLFESKTAAEVPASAQFLDMPSIPEGIEVEQLVSEASRRLDNVVPPTPPSPRRLPTPPVQSPVILANTSSPRELPSAPSPRPPLRTRSRSGTVSARAPLPTPPSVLPPAPTIPPMSSPITASPPRAVRKLPATPSDGLAKELPAPPVPLTRSVSLRGGGLPSDPAAGRRASMMGPNRPPPFAPLPPLPPLPEPNATDSPSIFAPPLRPLPQPTLSDSALPEARRVGPQSAGLPQTKSLDGVPELARSVSMSGRAVPRARRGSVLGSSGTVAGLARNYDGANGEFPPYLQVQSHVLITVMASCRGFDALALHDVVAVPDSATPLTAPSAT
jgi:hypothetical protein